MTRYAVYGGSFDPIHYGHLTLVERASALGYEVLMVPAYRHAFGKQAAPFVHRVRMCELALEARNLQQQARVCDIECGLAQGSDAPVYTYDVLRALQRALQAPPILLVGPDIAAEWQRWYRWEDIDREFGRVSLPMTRAIRSTEIRQRLGAGASPTSLQACMPEPVCAYLAAQELYSETLCWKSP